jgi:hypothetical protein
VSPLRDRHRELNDGTSLFDQQAQNRAAGAESRYLGFVSPEVPSSRRGQSEAPSFSGELSQKSDLIGKSQAKIETEIKQFVELRGSSISLASRTDNEDHTRAFPLM